METLKTTPTPELDKMLSNKEQSQSIGEFIDWLESKKKVLFRINTTEKIVYYDEKFEKEVKSVGEDSPQGKELRYNNMEKWEHTGGVIPFNMHIENILAEYFGIDLKKAEKERMSILENLRKK